MNTKDEIVLNEGQKEVMNALLNGDNVFLTGSAGTGKSVVIREFSKKCEETGVNIVIVAPTGIAALNVGGATIHRTFGVPTRPLIDDPPKIPNDILVNCDVLIIEEISMCRMDMFDYLSKMVSRANKVRLACGMEETQLVVVGDFFQLPPVLKPNEREVLEKHYNCDVGKGYAFQSEWWDTYNFKAFNLVQVMRQSDEEFIKNLDNIKYGNIKAIDYFKRNSSRTKTGKIELCGKNAMVKVINEEELSKINSKAKSFVATIKGNVSDGDKLTEDVIDLKIGARVVMLVNDQDDYYCNGSYGTVSGFFDSNKIIEVELDSGVKVLVEDFTWEVKKYKLNNEGGVKKIEEEVVGTFTQLPVRLAYAITIHKSQGQTYDTLSINPYSWEPGQLYVALSRVRNIEGLYIDGFLSSRYVITSPDVLDFYRKTFIK